MHTRKFINYALSLLPLLSNVLFSLFPLIFLCDSSLFAAQTVADGIELEADRSGQYMVRFARLDRWVEYVHVFFFACFTLHYIRMHIRTHARTHTHARTRTQTRMHAMPRQESPH